MKLKELQKKLDTQKKLTEEMKRKQEQGSIPLQGEVQELAIGDYLREQLPLDEVEDVKTGVRGADIMQVVNTRELAACGRVYYESKRTKTFDSKWIEKFKADVRSKGASVGVMVTQVFPIGMEGNGIKEGVWICSFEDFKC